MDGEMRPVITTVLGAGVIVFSLWVLWQAVVRRKGGPLTAVAIAAIFFYAAWVNLERYPLLAGFVGGFGTIFLFDALLEVLPRVGRFPLAWWVHLLMMALGVWLFWVYPEWYREQPPFVQGYSMLPWVVVVAVLLFAGVFGWLFPRPPAEPGKEEGDG